MSANAIQKYGAFVACVEAGVSPALIPELEGAFSKLASEDAAPLGRLLLRGAYQAMRVSGYGLTAPAQHLKLAATDPDWTLHSQELVDHTSEILTVLEPLEKQADILPDISEAGGTLARGLGYGAVGAGAGLGALLWSLGRHAHQEDAEQESLKKRINYYHSLSRELHNSLQRKYDYTGALDQGDEAEGITTTAQ